MTKGDKAMHPTCGQVEVLTPGDKETIVRLASGELRTVTTAWLKLLKSATDGTEATTIPKG